MTSLEPGPFLDCLQIGDALVLGPIHGGADAALWRVRQRGVDYALRVLRPEQCNAALRERAAMVAARAAGIPVPEVIAFAECWGRPVFLMEWCLGETALEWLRRSPNAVEPVGQLLGKTLAAIHAVPIPEALADHPPAGTSLLHGDFHPLNVLVDSGQVSGVIDWTDTLVGDPRADVARSLCLMLAVPAPAGLFPPPLSPERRAIATAFLHGYASVSHLPAVDLHQESLAPLCAMAAGEMLPILESRARRTGQNEDMESLNVLRAWQSGDVFWGEQ